MKPKVLFTDGEGPIVFKDMAADITEKIVPGFFPVLSFYDDYLAEVGTQGYQAGDTLALVVPHFIAHGVTNHNIAQEAKDGQVCKGVEEYIAGLKTDGWDVRIISTAYSQLWQLVGEHIGISMEDIACTDLDVDSLWREFGNKDFNLRVTINEQRVLDELPAWKKAMTEVNDEGRPVVDVLQDSKYAHLRENLDSLYWGMLPSRGYKPLEMVRVMGGRRKIEAAQRFVQDLGVEMSDVAYVGDSITDDAMHAHLSQEGGLPIAINGNTYALRNAKIAVATEDMRNIRPVLDAWHAGGFPEVAAFVQRTKEEISFSRSKEGAPVSEALNSGVRYDLVDIGNGPAFDEIKKVHKESRSLVRGAATARLG